MLKAYKLRIYPNDVQAQQIYRTFGCKRLIWNLMLADVKKTYAETKKFKQPTPGTYKEKFAFLHEVDSYALCAAQLDLSNTLAQYVKDKKKPRGEKKIKFPKFKSKKTSRRSYTTYWSHNNIRLEKDAIRLPKLGPVRACLHRRVQGKIKNVTVSQEASGKFYATVLTEAPNEACVKADTNNVVGLDFSFHSLFVTSDGAKPKFPRWYKIMERKLARAQRALSGKKEGSNGYYKQKHRVAIVHEKIKHRRLDLLRKLAKSILDRYDVIVVEGLDLHKMSLRGPKYKFGKTVTDLSFGIFRDLLRQGAGQKGKLFVEADKWFPSTQLCGRCGYKNAKLKDMRIRDWVCPSCGAEHDRDVNAAQNLVAWYHEHKNTVASTEIYAEGDTASTLSPGKSKWYRRSRKSCETIDLTSQCHGAKVDD
jgi:putative transposase